MKPRLAVICFLAIITAAASLDAGSVQQQVIGEAGYFFKALNSQDYGKAFNCLSKRLRIYYSFHEFKFRAQRVHYAKILGFKITESYEKLVRLTASAKLQLWYEGELYNAVYRGKVNLVKEGGAWKLDSCQLDPIGTAKPVSGKGIEKPGIIFEL